MYQLDVQLNVQPIISISLPFCYDLNIRVMKNNSSEVSRKNLEDLFENKTAYLPLLSVIK